MNYRIYKNIIYDIITPEQIKYLKKYVKKKGSYIFNPDYKRHQVQLNKRDKIYKKIINKLALLGITRGRIPNNMNILYSKAGCLKQYYHYDYNPEIFKRIKMRKKPGGLLMALENNTKFCLLKKDIILNKGDCLFFDGDCVHAGAAFDKDNIRLHIYLDVIEYKRVNNKTWLYKKYM